MKKYAAMLCLASTCLLAAPNLVAAETDGSWIIRDGGPHHRPLQLDISIGADAWWWGVGLGVAGWLAVPVVENGFIPGINNSFDIEGGLVFGLHPFIFGGVGLDFLPMIGGRWNFYLTSAWTVFATVKLGLAVLVNPTYLAFAGGGSVGAIWNFSEAMQLRIETGYPLPISVGLSFPLGK